MRDRINGAVDTDGESALIPDGGAGILSRYDKACLRRADWLPLWQDCYEYTLPESAVFTGRVSSPSRRRDHLFDGTAADAVDQLAASLLGHLAPPWLNWFGLVPGDDLTDEDAQGLAPVLDRATRVLQGQIDRSNLAVELHQCFLDLVVGGTACLQVDETVPGSNVSFSVQAVPLSDVVFDDQAGGGRARIYRRRMMTGLAIAELPIVIPVDAFESLLRSPEKIYEVIEFSEGVPNGVVVGAVIRDLLPDPVLIGAKLLSASPFIVFRWMKTAGESYGRSPVMKALPDIKTANKVVELVLKNASIATTGMWQAEDDGVLNPATIELVPGAIIPKAVGSAGLKPLEMPARFDVSQLVLDDLRSRIRHALLVDRFSAIENRAMTATEVMERSAEVGLLLGATYGRLQTELLTPLLTRLYGILRRRGDIPDLALDGRVVVLTHRSPLARAQAHQGVQTILTWVDAVGHLGAGAAQVLNVAPIVRQLAETLGISETLIRPDSLFPLTVEHSKE